MLSSFWTPSRQYNRPTANGKQTRRLSIASNVSLAYSPGTGMRFALRCQKKNDSSSSKPEEETTAPSTTSAAEQSGFKSFTPLLPLRQRAKRLTKMQGCYPPTSYHMSNSEDNITQQNATKVQSISSAAQRLTHEALDLANVIAAFRLEGAEEESSETARMRLSQRNDPAPGLPSQHALQARAEALSTPAPKRRETAPAEEEWETF